MTPETGANVARSIHVCMIIPSFYPVVGGAETQVESLIPFLRKYGVEARVLTRRPAGTPRFEVRDGIPIQRIDVWGNSGLRSIMFTIQGWWYLLRNRRRLDVLHAHAIMSPTTIAALGVLLDIPRVVTLHAAYELPHLFSKPLGRLRMLLYRSIIQRFVSINADIFNLLRDAGVVTTHIAQIPNGIDILRFRPADGTERSVLRRARNLPVDIPVVVFVGRLHPVKNVDVLLRAWRDVAGARLVILGDGPERARLEALAGELDIVDSVEFRGMVTDVSEYVRSADVFVLPSASEGLSVSLLEAMASGIAPVCSAVGSAPELIEDGNNGLLVPPGDVPALTTALRHTIENTTWRLTAGAAAHTVVTERFDLDRVARRLADLYQDILQR